MYRVFDLLLSSVFFSEFEWMCDANMFTLELYCVHLTHVHHGRIRPLITSLRWSCSCESRGG
jgi:hypothetical protein